MKNLFIATLMITGVSVFANNEEKPLAQIDMPGKACCQFTATNASGETVSARACEETGDTLAGAAAALARACARAKKAAEFTVNNM